MESKAKRIIDMMEAQLGQLSGKPIDSFKGMKAGTQLTLAKSHPQMGQLVVFHSVNPDKTVNVKFGQSNLIVKPEDLLSLA